MALEIGLELALYVDGDIKVSGARLCGAVRAPGAPSAYCRTPDADPSENPAQGDPLRGKNTTLHQFFQTLSAIVGIFVVYDH